MMRNRACYRLICNQPLLIFMVLFMIYLRLSFPFVLSFLIWISPIIICTAILLGGLLALGQKHAKGIQNDVHRSYRFSSSWPHCTTQNNGMTSPKDSDGDGGCFRDKFAEVRKDIVEKDMKEHVVRNMDGRDNSKDDKISGSKGNNNNVDHLMFVYNEKFPKTEFKNKLIDEVSRREDKGDDVDHSSSLSPSSSSSVYEGEYNMPLESSKDYVPTLCDYHPLVEFEDNHDQVLYDRPLTANNEHVTKLKGEKEENEVPSIVQEDHQEIHELSSSDNEHKEHLEELIQERCHDYDIDVDDDSEEGEQNDSEEEHDDDEDGDHNVEQGDIKEMVAWTEEDEKNLEDLSRLELERNRQLERIMSRRIAQRNYSTITEKSVMDLDTTDFPFKVAPVSTTKTNPFDFAYSTSNQPDITIPASAPAIFPRRNPFDDLDESHQNNPVHNTTTRDVPMKESMFDKKRQTFITRHHGEREGVVAQNSTEVSKREALFRRYQSFGVVGSSFYGFLWQENEQESINLFNPYYSPHKAHHSDSSNALDSSHDSSSDQASSSSSDVIEDQEQENVSDSSSEINTKENEVSSLLEVYAGEKLNHSDEKNDAMKVEGDSSSHVDHVDPVYDSYGTSPSAKGKNIFVSSETSK